MSMKCLLVELIVVRKPIYNVIAFLSQNKLVQSRINWGSLKLVVLEQSTFISEIQYFLWIDNFDV